MYWIYNMTPGIVLLGKKAELQHWIETFHFQCVPHTHSSYQLHQPCCQIIHSTPWQINKLEIDQPLKGEKKKRSHTHTKQGRWRKLEKCSVLSRGRKKQSWPKQLYCVALRWLWGKLVHLGDQQPNQTMYLLHRNEANNNKRTKNKHTKWSVSTYCMRHNKSPRFDNLRLNSVTMSCFPAAIYVF